MIKKAIIPAGGFGTRNLPVTKVIPKEMFPVGSKPVIHYLVEELKESGIEDILMVVSSHKNLIVDYFDSSLALEAFLASKNKLHLLREHPIPDIRIHYVRQPYAKGLGDAISFGKQFAGGEPFAVVLPDDLIFSDNQPALGQLIEAYTKYQSSVIGLKETKTEDLHHYGVIKGEPVEKGLYRIQDIVEKPKQNPPSHFAAAGRYIFTPDIFNELEALEADSGGEVQVTDAIKASLGACTVYGKLLEGERYDIGLQKDYLKLIYDMLKTEKNPQ
ncbi:UTP--glucose-1-phosphate uridylyltransferase [Bacillus subtilis]|uniref:UTP--glucose-1-phosphate uridylyltransferase n=1 Tax=Bacillus subtilis TaxID=1423 RepID=UPI002DBA55DA|nr:UTP--glucose-1-phosphate uridylyltransferase [Bacillus subtilis]MEC1919600.1 UTP--glucose-1-phosphate uridylyltransferase [Bacillus subtilis]